MIIENTYMGYGKGHGGIIVATTKPRSVQVWSNSLPARADLMMDLDALREQYPTKKTKQNKESEASITADQKDQNALQNSLQLRSHPLDPNSHDPNVLMNICSSEIASDKTNGHMAKIIGEKQMKEFQLSLPDGFNSTIPKKVVPMDNLGKRKLLRKKKLPREKEKHPLRM